MTKQANEQQKLRSQIMHGFVRVILFTCILGFVTLALQGGLYWNYQSVNQMEETRLEIQHVIVSHYSWRAQLSNSLQTGAEFEGSLSPASCSLGQWIQENTSDIQDNPHIAELVHGVETPHTEMHAAAADVLQTGEADPEAAIRQFSQDVVPYTDVVIQNLEKVEDYYTQQLNSAKATYQTLQITVLLAIVSVTAGIAAYSIMYGNHLAKRISGPVVYVTEWANRLALGIVESETEEEFLRMEEENKGNEVGTMIRAFQSMADNIGQNVHILQQVAEGDMTASVHIRSQQDSLGKILRHLVQSNNAVFNEIVKAAHTVASGADEIAGVSHSLAESATEQVTVVRQLSDAIGHTSHLIQRNDEQAHQAKQITDKIKQDTEVSNQHMKQLVESVMRIQEASKRISAVVKSIDDIAFETNILSLNAAMESARAGAAGKGFAVVAEEVRSLALKSAEAAQESKTLIQSSIDQAEQGSAIASESAKIFDAINDEILQIVGIVEQVSDLSAEQMEGISAVNRQIRQISEIASSNAAISQQSSASSQEMSQQAEILHQSMARFRLREWNQDQTFIAPEEQGDPDGSQREDDADYQ